MNSIEKIQYATKERFFDPLHSFRNLRKLKRLRKHRKRERRIFIFRLKSRRIYAKPLLRKNHAFQAVQRSKHVALIVFTPFQKQLQLHSVRILKRLPYKPIENPFARDRQKHCHHSAKLRLFRQLAFHSLLYEKSGSIPRKIPRKVYTVTLFFSHQNQSNYHITLTT